MHSLEKPGKVVLGGLTLAIDEAGRASLSDTQTGEPWFSGLLPGYETAEGCICAFDGGDRSLIGGRCTQFGLDGEEIVVQARDRNGLAVTWTLRLLGPRPVLTCSMTIANEGSEAIPIAALHLLTTEAGAGLYLQPLGELRCLSCQPHSWRKSELYYLDGTAESGLVTAIANAGNKGLVAGFLTFERELGRFALQEPEAAQGPIGFQAYHRFPRPVQLQPGKSLSSEWLYLDCTDNVLQSLEAWADLAGQVNHAVFAEPPAAGFYTWYYYRECIGEDNVLKVARFLAENRDRFPVNYIQLDSGWQRDYSCGETEANDNFPHGLAWLAEQIAALGFIPGLWVNAFMCDYPTARLLKERPELMQKDESGKPKPFGEPIRNIMGKDIPNMHTSIKPGRCYHLDSTSQATREYLVQKYRWVRSLGFRQVMLDFLDAGLPHDDAVVADPSMTEIEAVRGALKAVRQGIGNDAVILGSGAYFPPMIGIGNIIRTAGDICAHWKYVSKGCRQHLLKYFMHNRLFTAYADALSLREKPSPYWDTMPELSGFDLKLSLDEAQFYTAVTGLSGITVWVSEDVAALPPERQWLLSLLLPIYKGGAFRPLDLFRRYYPRVLRLDLEEGGRKWLLAAGLNWENLEAAVALDLAELGLEAGVTYHAFDVFKQQYLGQVTGERTIGPANARSVRLVNLVPCELRPQVVGTDLHITQGAVEIGEERWNPREKSLAIRLRDLAGRRGHISIWVPEGLEPASKDKPHALEPCCVGRIMRLEVTLDADKWVRIGFAATDGSGERRSGRA